MQKEIKTSNILKNSYIVENNAFNHEFQHLTLIIVLTNILFIFSCIDMSHFINNKISVNELITQYGCPDVIGERSGDLERLYRYNKPPKNVWPNATTKYYYIQKGIGFIIKKGYVVDSFPISEEFKKEILIPIITAEN
jgi:hypothetical protein